MIYNCLVIPSITVSAKEPGITSVSLTVERAHKFKCFLSPLSSHSPPLDLEIFLPDEDRLQLETNLTGNKEVIHLSDLTPYQDYRIMLRARPSLDLSRTIFSPWLNFSIQTLPDGQFILSQWHCWNYRVISSSCRSRLP